IARPAPVTQRLDGSLDRAGQWSVRLDSSVDSDALRTLFRLLFRWMQAGLYIKQLEYEEGTRLGVRKSGWPAAPQRERVSAASSSFRPHPAAESQLCVSVSNEYNACPPFLAWPVVQTLLDGTNERTTLMKKINSILVLLCLTAGTLMAQEPKITELMTK